MKTASYLIKPASSLCNLKCRYCFYHDVSENRDVKSTGIMNQTTMDNLILKACEPDQQLTITFAFQGGEPTLPGLDYFKDFISSVNQNKKASQQIIYTIQTNGTLLDQSWFTFLKQNNFLVGISLDGFKENHDALRIGHNDQLTFDLVMKTIEGLRLHQIEFNILTVLTSQLAKEPEKLYRFYRSHDFRYAQLIPCLPRLKGQSDHFALTPELFASFYKTFYDLWLIDFEKKDYLSVSLFDNVIPMYKGYKPMQCGMLGYCSPQFVIEADGSVYPCDFYALDEYCCGNINTDTLDQILHHPKMIAFLREKKTMSPLCETCRFKPICNGNCKRLNVTYFNETVCGYRDFLEYAYPSMIKIAQRL
jgi:uncharacterized protein